MIKKVHFLLATVVVFTTASVAQSYQPYLNIPVTQSGNLIVPTANAWTGGFDAPVLQEIDLNGDGIKDLFAFEKGGASQTYFRYTTYINHGTPGQVDYEYAPQYKSKFPPLLHDWVLLVDYDCDGKEDIFTYSFLGGMAVYHNDYTVAQGLSFSLYMPLIYTEYYGIPNINLYVASVNQPALVDVDNDNDLDVLTFAIASNTLEYHRNYAQELFNRCDTFIYVLEKSCWGKFCLSPFTNVAILGCPDTMGCTSGPNFTVPVPDRTRFIEQLRQSYLEMEKTAHLHSGSCMIAPDLDGDGDKDVINGDLLGSNLLYLENGGGTIDSMIAQDTLFPLYDVPVDFRTFPSAYYMDADNDGKKDLTVAGCIANASRNFNNVLFYKNTTNNITNVFDFQQDDLYVDKMIEVGSGANVSLFDADGDGLEDMIIGNYRYVYQNPASDHTAVAYYRNTGSATQPSFDLVTKDYSTLSNLGLLALCPTFGDLNGDLAEDMIVGTDNGYLIHYLNTAGVGNPAVFTMISGPYLLASNGNPINVGSYATPVLIDLNRDGKLDLVIGEKIGNLNYYENIGTSGSPSFVYVTNNLGGINVTKVAQDINGYSSPFVYDSSGFYQLYVGSLSGYIYKFDNIDGNLAGNFNLVDSMFLYEPIRSTITGTDINGDSKLDLLIGNNAGGVTWFSDNTVSVNEHTAGEQIFNLYPNPAHHQLTIKFENTKNKKEHEIIITDLLGKIIYTKKSRLFVENIDLRNWSNGMYVCKVVENESVATLKFIVHH